jgi:hypothetical protein
VVKLFLRVSCSLPQHLAAFSRRHDPSPIAFIASAVFSPKSLLPPDQEQPMRKCELGGGIKFAFPTNTVPVCSLVNIVPLALVSSVHLLSPAATQLLCSFIAVAIAKNVSGCKKSMS